VRHSAGDRNASEALAGFQRFPSWLWRNADVVEFVEWLRAWNQARTEPADMAGFYGLDLYNLRASIEAVVSFLERADPRAAQRVRASYACFDSFGENGRGYAFLAGSGITRGCKAEAVAGLLEIQRLFGGTSALDPRAASDDRFDALQNARLVRDAEAFYHSMFQSESTAWNLREQHMAETLDELLLHLDRPAARAKIVVWAHNSHVGDARATEVARRGQVSLGQLARERHGQDTVLVGFTTYRGTVTAAVDWERAAQRQRVPPAHHGSYEQAFHGAGLDRFLLPCRDTEKVATALRRARLEREIGVIYRPDPEPGTQYLSARLPDQFDAVLHFDETLAVEPLEPASETKGAEVPPTFPFSV
jgi:erythromycin esterase-like protein